MKQITPPRGDSWTALAVLCVLPLLASCAAPYETPALDARPPGKTAFPGLARLVKSAPNHTVDVLLVHGMCTHGREWAEGTIRMLNSALDGVPDPKVHPVAVEGIQTMLYQSSLAVPGGPVRATAVVWSPIVAKLKHQLCYDQTNKSGSCKAAGFERPAYPYERASINRVLIDGLLNDCIADALIYQGKSRNAISADLQTAILTAASDSVRRSSAANSGRAAAAESTPLVIVTESLGSKMAFDAIYKLATSQKLEIRAAGLQMLERSTQIFMGANQMPLLALADQTLDGAAESDDVTKDYPADSLGALIDLRKRKLGDVTRAPRVVAFTDPNDLLSYTLVSARQAKSYDVVDVIVSNAATYFGMLEHPAIAHLGYLENATVLRLISCGNPESEAC